MTYNLNIHRQHYRQNKCQKLSQRYWTNDVHSLQSSHLIFTLYLIMQHTTGAQFSSSVFNLFLVPLCHHLAIASSVSQSPDNTAFKESIIFWKSMKTLPVFRSSTSNSKRSALILSHFCSCSIMAALFQACLFVMFWLTKFGRVSKLSPILSTWDCFLFGILLHE